MRISYIVYKKDLTNDKDRGVRIGLILQTEKGLNIQFVDGFKERLANYDSDYDRLILDSLPDTLTTMSKQKTFQVSTSQGGNIDTSSPLFIDKLREIYRSNILISEPKPIELKVRNQNKTLQTKLANI